MNILLVAFIACLALSGAARADDVNPPLFAGKTEMNGLSLAQFPDFEKKWHFVTVRYREDSREMRLVYANDLAWKALNEGGKDYPDGAVFAKIGIVTTEDPAFVSSRVPAGGKRFQLMKMDHAHHKDTAGWVYALFDADGKTTEGDPAKLTEACHACHALVPERGYVFAQVMHLQMGVPALTAANLESGKLKFETVAADTLSPLVRNELPEGATKVRVLRGAMEQKNFDGTIDEIKPSLVREALSAGIPAALIGLDGRGFALVHKGERPDPAIASAPNPGTNPNACHDKTGITMTEVSKRVLGATNYSFSRQVFCYHP